MNGLAREFGVKIPQGTIDGIAGGAGGQHGSKLRPRQAVAQRLAGAFQLSPYAGHGFTIAGIGHTLAPASDGAIDEFDEQNVCRGFCTTRYGEGPGDREGLVVEGDLTHRADPGSTVEGVDESTSALTVGVDRRQPGLVLDPAKNTFCAADVEGGCIDRDAHDPAGRVGQPTTALVECDTLCQTRQRSIGQSAHVRSCWLVTHDQRVRLGAVQQPK